MDGDPDPGCLEIHADLRAEIPAPGPPLLGARRQPLLDSGAGPRPLLFSPSPLLSSPPPMA